MKARIKLATARTPDGCEMLLFQHDGQYSIRVDGCELMNSRQHESELELARLGCASLTSKTAPCVLIGGLGLGYTLRQTLDMVGPKAHVVVAELLGTVVDWNREFLGELNGRPVEDERVDVRVGDVVDLIAHAKGRFDAILLDVDNGPSALTHSANQRLYGGDGIRACRRALRRNGCLAVWSCGPSRHFEQLLTRCEFYMRRYRAPAYKGSKSRSRYIWVASQDKTALPPDRDGPHRPPGAKPTKPRTRGEQGSSC